MIKQKIKCKDTLWLIEDIVLSFPGGKNTPIGNFTSPWFSNYYLNALDQFVKQELKIKNYIRYNDDFCLFHDDKAVLADAAKRIEQFLDERLQMKYSKCDLFPTSRGVDYLGYRHFHEKKLCRKSTAKRFARNMKAIPGLLESGKITPEVARSKIASTYGHLLHANTHNLIVKMGLDGLKETVNEQCRQRKQAGAAAQAVQRFCGQ
jgi:hypothetical protein